jgi:mutator protein MutT
VPDEGLLPDVAAPAQGKAGPAAVSGATLHVVAAVVEDGDRFLVTRRQAGVHLAGMWEFPGGKVAAGETHAQALRREMQEELGTDVEVGALVSTAAHAYDDRHVTLHFYACQLETTPRPLLGQEMRWVPRGELRSLGFPRADEELIALLTRDA